MNLYETDRLLGEYLLFHFGADEEILPWESGPREALGFPVRTVAHFGQGRVERALDLGCAVGRSAFEMSMSADQVIGIDFSQKFVDAAEHLARQGSFDYLRTDEIPAQSRLTAKLPEGVDGGGVSFEQGDAMNLREDLGSFDRVHAANLLCRLPEPQKLLQRLPDLVKSGGELVIATPCTWLEEFTPLDNWPEGGTLEWLKGKLSGDFSLERTDNEPFLIREHARKFQWSVSQISVWRRL